MSNFVSLLPFYILLVPVIGLIGLFWFKKKLNHRVFTLGILMLNLLLSMLLWFYFDNFRKGFQFVTNLRGLHFWESYDFFFLQPEFNFFAPTLGVDGFSIFFIILTNFIMIICLLVNWEKKKHHQVFCNIILFMDFLILGVFLTLDLFFFFVFFESILIPMFLIILYWGSSNKKIRAAYYLFMYTIVGSIFMLFAILLIYIDKGTTDIIVLTELAKDQVTMFSYEKQKLLWICFFIAFSIKVPMFPFYLWLPEAHVEAPTFGSIILASLLLKFGGYGFLRVSLNLLPEASIYFSPIVYSFGIISILFASITAVRQADFKRIIAYSSIAHMNFTIIGIFIIVTKSIAGSILVMLGHGLISTGMFFIVGILYDRHHSRLVRYYGGLVQVMPLLAVFFFIFTLGNIGFPGTFNFLGELLVMVGVIEQNIFVTLCIGLSILLGIFYSMWLFNRIIFGSPKIKSIFKYKDMNLREITIASFLAILIIAIGIFPAVITDSLEVTVEELVKKYY
jgi:proton-translocating NADH-quinone oxidoreductase chain M